MLHILNLFTVVKKYIPMKYKHLRLNKDFGPLVAY